MMPNVGAGDGKRRAPTQCPPSDTILFAAGRNKVAAFVRVLLLGVSSLFGSSRGKLPQQPIAFIVRSCSEVQAQSGD